MPRNPSGDDHDDDDGDLEREIDDWEPSPMPPMAPDHGPVLTPAAPPSSIPDGQGLCTDGPDGPCAHYHRLVVLMDAARPLDGSDPEHLPRRTIHTCYPSVGIEYDIGEQHVFECNRYSPVATSVTHVGDFVPLTMLTERSRPTPAPSTLSTPPRAAPRSARAPKKRRRPGRR